MFFIIFEIKIEKLYLNLNLNSKKDASIFNQETK